MKKNYKPYCSIGKFIPFAICAAILAGCATFHPQPISPQVNASALEGRTLDNPSLKKFMEENLHRRIHPWPLPSWDFSMLTLAAFYYSPDLDMARARWQVAQAGKITAGERPNPSISVRPGAISNPSASPLLFGVAPNIPIETGGKRGYRLSLAGHLARAAYLDIKTAAWQVRSRLRARLLDLYFSIQTSAVLKRQVEVQRKLAHLLSVLLKNGEIPRPEFTRAQISLDSSRLKWVDVQRRIGDNRARLAAALGVPVSALRQVKISYGFPNRFPKAPALGALKQKALLHRSDILSALANYQAAQSSLQLEIAKQYPDVNLGPGYSFDDSENKWTFGVSLTLPLLNRNQGPIARAKARRKEAASAFTCLQARVIEELDRGEAGYGEMFLKLKTAEALEVAAKVQMDSARRAFMEGETSRLALLSARLVFYADLLQRVQASYQAQQALGLLEDALQSPLSASARRLQAIQINPGEGDNHP
ncbi:MAG: TolC family protein [Syntrophobacteraceae bacterium]|nr:TolC family protein [Syntrophobacteraceae bacterium]